MNKEKTKTTYGVYNLIEWHALLRMGKATVKVPFTGGSITTQGVTPATYTTEDPIIQFAIERSPEFTRGKIKIVRRVKLSGLVEIERNVPAPATIPEADGNNQDSVISDETESGGSDETISISDDVPSDDVPSEKHVVEMEFDNNDDAKDFLETEFGCVRSKLRTRADIIATGKANGIAISFS